MSALTEHLDDALTALLAARVAAGMPEAPPAPQLALDEALGADPAFQDARAAFRDAIDSGSILQVEAAHNHAVATAVEIGWLVATSLPLNTPTPEAPR